MDESCSIQTLPFSCIKMRNRYQNLLRNKSLIFGGHLTSQGKDEENPDKEVSDNGTAVKTGDYTNMWQYAFTAIAAFIVTASVFGLKEWKRKR